MTDLLPPAQPGIIGMLAPFLLIGVCICIGHLFFRKGVAPQRSQTVPDDLIKKGNQLIISAQQGQVGFSEDQIRGLQASYLRKTNWWEGWKLRTVAFTIGAFVIMAGVGGFYEGSDPNFGRKIFFGFLVCGGLLIHNTVLQNIRNDRNKYVSLVESEFQKIEEKEAA
jgi:hypothetical protein